MDIAKKAARQLSETEKKVEKEVEETLTVLWYVSSMLMYCFQSPC